MAAGAFVWNLPIRASYALWRKNYTGGIAARARAFWHHVVRGYRFEVCGECGRPVGCVWTAPDDLWRQVMGHEGGLLCALCFDDELDRQGRAVAWVPIDLGDTGLAGRGLAVMPLPAVREEGDEHA